MKMPIKQNYYDNILWYYHIFWYLKKAKYKLFTIDKSSITPIKPERPKFELSIDRKFLSTPNGREIDMVTGREEHSCKNIDY